VPNAQMSPRPAIAAQFDARPWAGTAIYTLGANTVTAPSTWGVYDDGLALLTGRGTMPTDLASLQVSVALATGLTLADVAVSINQADRVVVAVTTGTTVTIAAGAANARWGFDPAGQSSITVGAQQVLTGVADWQRGNIPPAAQMTWAMGISSGSVPASTAAVHSVLDTVRGVGLGPDAVTDSLATLDAAAGSVAARWGITPDGHVFRSRVTASGALLAWVSLTFRDRLGFTGAEVEVVDGAVSTLTATHPLPGLLTPTRPMDHAWRGHDSRGAATLRSDAGAAYAVWLDLDTIAATMYLDGPADRIDRESHWLRHVRPMMPPGAPCELYQDWGDYRRAVRTVDTTPAGPTPVARRPIYSADYTSQRDGEYGRLRLRVGEGAPRAVVDQYGARIKRRLPIDIVGHIREGGQ